MSDLAPFRAADQAGYTLVEFLGVAVILILLSVLSLPIFLDATDQARDAKSAEDMRAIEGALEVYQAERGAYPDSLNRLVERGYLKPTSFESPWSGDENRIYFFYAVDHSGDDRAKAYALGDPGVSGADCGTSWKSEQSIFYADATMPLPCGRNPFGSTSPAYVLAPVKTSDKPLLDETKQPLSFEPPYLSGMRPDIRTER